MQRQPLALHVLYVACIMLLLSGYAHAGGDMVEPRVAVDMPTAGVLHRGQYSIATQMYRGGGMTAGISVGVFERMMIGVSFGGNGIIGAGDVTWQRAPGVSVKFRVIDESILPAFAIGFDSQGNEGYVDGAHRYTVKSPGFYIAVSKNYAVLGYLSFHGCLNYSLENDDSSVPNLSVAAEKSIGDNVAVTAEYNFGLNDHNTTPQFGKDRGYLNLGLRWMVGGGLALEADVKNLLGNQDGVPAGARVIRIEDVQHLN